MNIVFLLPEYPSLGGVQTVTTQMANYFHSLAYEVSILSLPPRTTQTRSLRIALEPEISLQYLPDAFDYNSKQNLRFIREYIEQGGPSVVINQGAFSKVHTLFPKGGEHKVINVLRGCPAWEAVRKRKFNTFQNTVLSTQGLKKRLAASLRYVALKSLPGLSNFLARKELYNKIVGADRFVVLAPGYIAELHALWPDKIAPGQILAIDNPLTGQLPVSARKPQVMYAGRLSKEDKRIDRLLRIWKLIEDRVPAWSFRIIGQGPEQLALEKYAQQLGLKRLQFEEARMDDSLYAQASIIALSSSYEGYGMVLLEARQAGIVPIAFNCSAGVAHAITHQRNGLLIPAFDEQAFAEALLQLIQDEALRRRLSQQAVKDAEQNDMARIGPLWISLFDDLFAENQSTQPDNRKAGATALSQVNAKIEAAPVLEVLISTYAQPLQPIIDRLPPPMEGVRYLLSCQGHPLEQTQAAPTTEQLGLQSASDSKASHSALPTQLRPDLRISYTDSTGIAANRNNSLRAAEGNIVWLLDDDVAFDQSDLQRILECYRAKPALDVACFRIRTPDKRAYKSYKDHSYKMKSLDDIRNVSSIEITFRLEAVRNRAISFDERFGLGRAWPCGEEFLFLAACLKAGLHIQYFPIEVVEHPFESTIKQLSQYSPELLEKSGAVNALLYGKKAWLRNLLSLVKSRKAIQEEGMSACDFLRHKNRGSRTLFQSNRDASA